MRRTSFENWPCPVARVVDLFGDSWTTLVLRDAFYGIRRFDEFRRSLGIARNTLADRLRLLVDEGLLEKAPYQADPERFEYLLTDKGRDFFPVLAAMARWGDRWLTGADGPPITFRHVLCGHDTSAEVVCAECGEPLGAGDTEMTAGPGFPQQLLQREEVRRRFGADA